MRRVTVVFVAAVLAAGVAAAQGAGKPPTGYDGKTYNGNFCKARYGDQAGDFVWLVRGIKNESATEYREISCPFLQDDLSGLGYAQFALAFKNAGGDLCCTFYSFDPYGDEIVDSAEICATVPVWTWYPLPDTVELSSFGYLGLYCSLPPGSTLFSYGVREYYQTDDDN